MLYSDHYALVITNQKQRNTITLCGYLHKYNNSFTNLNQFVNNLENDFK